MFTSDWKSIRCEEVLKKHGQDQSHNPEFLRRSLGTSERTPPQPRYSGVGETFLAERWGSVFHGQCFYLWTEFLGTLSDQLLPINLPLWSHQKKKKRLIALAVEDLIITFFYLAQFEAWVLPQIKHKISKPFHLFSKNSSLPKHKPITEVSSWESFVSFPLILKLLALLWFF